MSATFLFRFRDVPSERDVLFAYSARRGFDWENLSTAVEADLMRHLAPDEILVGVRLTDFLQAKKDSKRAFGLELLRERLGGRTAITLLPIEKNGREALKAGKSQRMNVGGPTLDPTVDFETLKTRAITDIFDRRGGFVQSTPNFHFQNPSGKHTEKFIRLSNVLIRGSEVGFVALCTLSLIPPGARVVYVDTPSLLVVVSAINNLLRDFDSAREPLVGDSFGSYKGSEEFLFERPLESVVIISASSSGDLAKDLQSKQGFGSDQIFHLLYLGEERSDVRAVCNLVASDNNPNGLALRTIYGTEDSCELCTRGSHAIPLQGDNFDIPGPQPTALEILKADAPVSLSPLMQRLAGHGAFSIGLGTTNLTAPRQFHLRSDKLFLVQRYQERLNYVLDKVVPARLSHIIQLDDEADLIVANIGSRFAGKTKPAVLRRGDVSSMPQGLSSPVMIVASVVESGRALQDISRDLRISCRDAPQIYLAGFLKYESEEKLESLRKTLAYSSKAASHELVYVDSIQVPSSAGLTNSWHAELEILQALLERKDISQDCRNEAKARVHVLGQLQQPLVDNLFLPVSRESHLGIQPGFAFWPPGITGSSQADVYFTTASVVQRLRAVGGESGHRGLHSNWLQQSLLAPTNFGRFNDGVIQASLLRAARPAELNFAAMPALSREMGRIVRRILESASAPRGEAAAEFLLAIAAERLRLSTSDLKAVLADIAGLPPLVEGLRKHCAAKLLPLP